MAIFISYNHEDSDMAERIALELARRDFKVWKDSWRLGVGDSLIEKVQDGLEGARFFCVLFSQNSLKSEWVKRELTAGLLREIEEREVMILPILLDDSRLPLLVRDKVYADFRDDFEAGLKAIVSVVEPYYRTQTFGRVSDDDHYFIDYSGSTALSDQGLSCEIDAVAFDTEETYSILLQIHFRGSPGTTLESLCVQRTADVTELLLDACVSEFTARPAHVKIVPGKTTTTEFPIQDQDGRVLFRGDASLKILGNMKKGALTFNLGAVFAQIDSTRTRRT